MIGKLFGAWLCFGLAACGQTGIRNAVLTTEKNLPRPSRILVYDFAVSEREITEYQGIMRQQPSVKDSAERERQLAREVKDALAEEVADGLASWDLLSSAQAVALQRLEMNCSSMANSSPSMKGVRCADS
jgi:hypothetical protein